MKSLIVVAILVLALAAGAWLLLSRSGPDEVGFAPALRETLVDTLSTNGKAEPAEWAAVRAEVDGTLARVAVARGQQVSAGAVIAELDSSAKKAELASAEARIVQAKAELAVIQDGGRASEMADIEGLKQKAELELKSAQRETASLERLVARKAATDQELSAARDRAAQAQAVLDSLAARRKTLVSKTDRAVAEAKLRDAESAAAAARRVIALAVVKAPMAGVVYNVELRPGAYVNPGDEIARIGQVKRMKVLVYVDEPELGRVKVGMPVTVTWDAKAAKEWKGAVERMPTEVGPLGTRQVGEVVCYVDNPEGELPPGANINAAIRSSAVENALTIPKEALRRDTNNAPGVFVLEGDHVAWRAVKTGVSNITRSQVLEGLKDGDKVALPSGRALKNGDKVKAK